MLIKDKIPLSIIDAQIICKVNKFIDLCTVLLEESAKDRTRRGWDRVESQIH